MIFETTVIFLLPWKTNIWLAHLSNIKWPPPYLKNEVHNSYQFRKGMLKEMHEYPELCSTRQCHTSVFPPLIGITCFIYHPHEPSCVVSQVKLMVETKKLSASATDAIPESETQIVVFLGSLVNWAFKQRCFVWWVRSAVLEHHVSIAFVIAKKKRAKIS